MRVELRAGIRNFKFKYCQPISGHFKRNREGKNASRIVKNEDGIVTNEDGIVTNEDAFVTNEDGIVKNQDAFITNEESIVLFLVATAIKPKENQFYPEIYFFSKVLLCSKPPRP
jgi:hypothetical protein